MYRQQDFLVLLMWLTIRKPLYESKYLVENVVCCIFQSVCADIFAFCGFGVVVSLQSSLTHRYMLNCCKSLQQPDNSTHETWKISTLTLWNTQHTIFTTRYRGCFRVFVVVNHNKGTKKSCPWYIKKKFWGVTVLWQFYAVVVLNPLPTTTDFFRHFWEFSGNFSLLACTHFRSW